MAGICPAFSLGPDNYFWKGLYHTHFSDSLYFRVTAQLSIVLILPPVQRIYWAIYGGETAINSPKHTYLVKHRVVG
jgi:hypothetical protein